MEDILTNLPPPSRFFEEDLDNFATKSPPLPPPFLRLNPNRNPNPSLLIIFISSPSLSLLRRIPHKTLIGTLTLSAKPSNIYSTNLNRSSAILVPIPRPVPDETSRAVAKAVLGEIRSERVLIMDSIKAENCRSRLADGALCFKLETEKERMGEERMAGDWEVLPSGSVMGGLGAAVIGECQMRGWKAAMCATAWMESGRVEVEEKLRDLMRGLGFDVDGDEDGDDDGVRVSSRFHSEMYV